MKNLLKMALLLSMAVGSAHGMDSNNRRQNNAARTRTHRHDEENQQRFRQGSNLAAAALFGVGISFLPKDQQRALLFGVVSASALFIIPHDDCNYRACKPGIIGLLAAAASGHYGLKSYRAWKNQAPKQA